MVTFLQELTQITQEYLCGASEPALTAANFASFVTHIASRRKCRNLQPDCEIHQEVAVWRQWAVAVFAGVAWVLGMAARGARGVSCPAWSPAWLGVVIGVGVAKIHGAGLAIYRA